MEIYIMLYYADTRTCLCISKAGLTYYIDPFKYCYPDSNGYDLIGKRFIIPKDLEEVNYKFIPKQDQMIVRN